jgi:cytochrome c6
MKSRNVAKTIFIVIALVFGLFLFMQSSGQNRVSAKSSGADVYRQHCASCHGGDGKAATAKGKRKGATDLTKSAISDARGIKLITNGRDQMPGFKSSLTETEISDVMAYIRGFRK